MEDRRDEQDQRETKRTRVSLPDYGESDVERVNEIKTKQREVLAESFTGAGTEAKERFEGLLSRLEAFADQFVKGDALAIDNSPNSIYSCSPSWIKSTILPMYQVDGLNWLINMFQRGLSCVLHYEMGLGKSVQIISLLQYLHHERGIHGPHLIVTPASIAGNWINEIRRYSSGLYPIAFFGSKNKLNEAKKEFTGKFEVMVTTSDLAIEQAEFLSQWSWRYIIIDDPFLLKREEFPPTFRSFSSQHRLFSTSFPIFSIQDLWKMIGFLFGDIMGPTNDLDSHLHENKDLPEQISNRLQQIVAQLTLRKRKSEIENDLPPMREINILCEMTRLQKELYISCRNRVTDTTNGVTSLDPTLSNNDQLNYVMMLRRICSHPYTFGSDARATPTPGEHLILNSGKLMMLDKILPKLKEQGARVVLFALATKTLDILEEYLQIREFSYRRLDLASDRSTRQVAHDDFNAKESDVFILLISTTVAESGLPLAVANTAIYFETHNIHQVVNHGMKIVSYPGKFLPITVIRLLAKDTFEEMLVNLQQTLPPGDIICYGGQKLEACKDAEVTDDDLDLARYGLQAHDATTE